MKEAWKWLVSVEPLWLRWYSCLLMVMGVLALQTQLLVDSWDALGCTKLFVRTGWPLDDQAMEINIITEVIAVEILSQDMIPTDKCFVLHQCGQNGHCYRRLLCSASFFHWLLVNSEHFFLFALFLPKDIKVWRLRSISCFCSSFCGQEKNRGEHWSVLTAQYKWRDEKQWRTKVQNVVVSMIMSNLDITDSSPHSLASMLSIFLS